MSTRISKYRGNSESSTRSGTPGGDAIEDLMECALQPLGGLQSASENRACGSFAKGDDGESSAACGQGIASLRLIPECLTGGTMMQTTIAMAERKNIALVAHDNKKEELVEWVKFNCKLLAEHSLYATGTTGQLLERRLGLNVTHLESGPLGGDLQIGSRISEGQIDFVIFFSDPLEPQPHDPDVKALLRIALVWNIPVAPNRASADFIISSPLMSTVYERLVPDYSGYRARLAVGTR
jgi:methylglyoxal synthase